MESSGDWTDALSAIAAVLGAVRQSLRARELDLAARVQLPDQQPERARGREVEHGQRDQALPVPHPHSVQYPVLVFTRCRSSSCRPPFFASVSHACAMSSASVEASVWPSVSFTSARMIVTWSALGGSV